MSRTVRTDKLGKKFNEGKHRQKGMFKCQCWFCTGGKNRDEEDEKAFKKIKHKILQRN